MKTKNLLNMDTSSVISSATAMPAPLFAHSVEGFNPDGPTWTAWLKYSVWDASGAAVATFNWYLTGRNGQTVLVPAPASNLLVNLTGTPANTGECALLITPYGGTNTTVRLRYIQAA